MLFRSARLTASTRSQWGHPTVKVKVAVVKNGKEARSAWRILRKGQGYSLLAVRIFTGRTHQIRVHMAHVGHPLWGDKLYGRGGQALTPPVPGVLLKHDPAPRQMLHAWHLAFVHPFTGQKMAFTCPPPEDFVQTALTLERHMRRVVVTGAAGSGKSLFMRMLAEEGVPVWSADAAVIRLYEPGQEAWQALRLRYGDRFIPDGRSPVDRKALAAALLPSAEPGVDVHELENLLHPPVLDDLERFWGEQEEAGLGYAVAEVPLWFESGWNRRLCGGRKPYVVGISCEQAERCRRLLDVYGSAREVFEAVGKEDLSGLLTPGQCGRLSTDPAVFAPMEARCAALGAQVLTMADPDYPSRLMDIEDAPPALFVTGEVSALNAGHTVGMIGSRRPSAYGVEAHNLSPAGLFPRRSSCLIGESEHRPS